MGKPDSADHDHENIIDRRTPSWIESLVLAKSIPIPLGITLHTTRGLGMIRWLGQRFRSKRKLFDAGTIGLFIAGTLGIMAFAYMATDSSVRNGQATEASNALALPGVNDYLPLFATGFIIASLLVTMLVHEVGHAVIGEAHGYEVQDWGVMLVAGFIPFGAFVRSDVDDIEESPVRHRLRFFAGGILANWMLSGVALLGFRQVVSEKSMDVLANASGQGPEWIVSFVASMNPTAHFLFWLYFFNVNLLIANALPVRGLDGGHVLHAVLDWVSERVGFGEERSVQAVNVSTVVCLAAFAWIFVV